MTARQEVRIGTRPKQAETWSYETQRAPHIGEVLKTARERKGVDLARAERETKIRARHLAALEAGDFDDLPASVYTKGFLRNYSTYLGLDAEEMLSRWRRESDMPGRAEPVKVMAPPQPITAPSRGFKLTSGLIIALVLAAVVSGFLGYVGLQLVRFTQNPEITLHGPAQRSLASDQENLVIVGSAAGNADITATGAGEFQRATVAGASGSWTLNLPVSAGQNDFTIFATDAETGRDSEPVNVIATVRIDETTTPGAVATPALPAGASVAAGEPSAEIILTSPAKGTVANNGRVKVEGTSDAESVLVSFQWVGRPENKRKAPDALELAVTEGVFSGRATLPQGKWQVAVAGEIGGGAPGLAMTSVRSVFDQTVLKISAVEGGTRINVVTNDDEEKYLVKGLQLPAGKSHKITTDRDVIVSVGNAQVAHLTVDGVDYGKMGKKSESRSWRVDKGEKAKQIN
jgi:hypothetical protein